MSKIQTGSDWIQAGTFNLSAAVQETTPKQESVAPNEKDISETTDKKADKNKEKMRQATFNFSEQDLRRLRISAAKNNQSMNAYIRYLINREDDE